MNTKSSQFLTPVQNYLTFLGSLYLGGRRYCHRSDPVGQQVWRLIKEHFDFQCVYCLRSDSERSPSNPLTQEHLVERNRFQCGLHHPANTVPACRECNQARNPIRKEERVTWRAHLARMAKIHGVSASSLKAQRDKIAVFMKEAGYPEFSRQDLLRIRDKCCRLHAHRPPFPKVPVSGLSR